MLDERNIERKFRCCNCGKIFDYPKAVQEGRGEFWGIPCTETMYYSPCCTDDFEELIGDEVSQEGLENEHLE